MDAVTKGPSVRLGIAGKNARTLQNRVGMGNNMSCNVHLIALHIVAPTPAFSRDITGSRGSVSRACRTGGGLPSLVEVAT